MVIIILIKKPLQAVNRTLRIGCVWNVLANEEPEEEAKCPSVLQPLLSLKAEPLRFIRFTKQEKHCPMPGYGG